MTTENYHTIDSLDMAGRTVLLRSDLNVPIQNGIIGSDHRLRSGANTIQALLDKGAGVLIVAHLGRPTANGLLQPDLTMAPIARWLGQRLNMDIPVAQDWLQSPPKVKPGEVILLENVRFYAGESENDRSLAAQMAQICDIMVMDAFGVAHRSNASTDALLRLAPKACIGPLMAKELTEIDKVISSPQHPLVTICGGAKISDKLLFLHHLVKISDCVVIGGAMANTFFAAMGHTIGHSLYEPALIHEATLLLETPNIFLPEYVVAVDSIDNPESAGIYHVSDVEEHQSIIDIAPRGLLPVEEQITEAKTVMWNGPMGMFERDAYAAGTACAARLVAQNKGYSLVGGGDTISAAEKFDMLGNISYYSTGGGAFLAALEGTTLPSIAAFKSRSDWQTTN